MGTPIDNNRKAWAQLTTRIKSAQAAELLNLPKRALAMALVELASLGGNNGSNVDDYEATGRAAVELARRFK